MDKIIIIIFSSLLKYFGSTYKCLRQKISKHLQESTGEKHWAKIQENTFESTFYHILAPSSPFWLLTFLSIKQRKRLSEVPKHHENHLRNLLKSINLYTAPTESELSGSRYRENSVFKCNSVNSEEQPLGTSVLES